MLDRLVTANGAPPQTIWLTVRPWMQYHLLTFAGLLHNVSKFSALHSCYAALRYLRLQYIYVHLEI